MKEEYIISSGVRVYPAKWPPLCEANESKLIMPSPCYTKYVWKFTNEDILLELHSYFTIRLPNHPICNEEGYNCFSVHMLDTFTDMED